MTAATRTAGGLSELRLGLFIAVSIAAHCLLLAGWNRDDQRLPPASGLTVTVITAQHTTPSAAEKSEGTAPLQHSHTPVKPAIRQPGPGSATKSENATGNASEAIAANTGRKQPLPQDNLRQASLVKRRGADTANASNVVTIGNKGVSLGQMKERIDEQLHNNFARHFHYPYLAQRRSWQGEVRLGLRVEASGRLSHIRIVKSSGYAILDQAAVDSLKKVAAIPDADHWLQGNAFDTVLPVEYHLIDS